MKRITYFCALISCIIALCSCNDNDNNNEIDYRIDSVFAPYEGFSWFDSRESIMAKMASIAEEHVSPESLKVVYLIHGIFEDRFWYFVFDNNHRLVYMDYYYVHYVGDDLYSKDYLYLNEVERVTMASGANIYNKFPYVYGNTTFDWISFNPDGNGSTFMTPPIDKYSIHVMMRAVKYLK